MNQDEGNVQHQEAPAQEEVIRPGDYVYLTPQAIRKAPRFMGPIKMYSIGWPNEFQVVDVFEEGGITWLVISGCCRNLVVNRKSGAWLCGAHEAKWFRKFTVPEPKPAEPEKKEPDPSPRERKPGDRITSVEVPVLGEIGAIEYLDDEHNPKFVIRAAKQRFVLNGKAGVEIAKILQANGFL